MNKNRYLYLLLPVFLVLLLLRPGSIFTKKGLSPKKDTFQKKIYYSPINIAFSPDRKRLYVVNHDRNSLSVINPSTKKTIKEISVGKRPTDIAVSPDGKYLYVSDTASHTVSKISSRSLKLTGTIKCGYEPKGLALTSDGRILYTANYISGDVSVIDTEKNIEIKRIPVTRAPFYLALTPNNRRLAVNNTLSAQKATNPKLTAHISLIDTEKQKVIKKIFSPGTMLSGMGICFMRNGGPGFSVHLRPNFNITPAQLNQGWTVNNMLTIFNIPGFDRPVTVALDNVSSGAANPYDVIFSNKRNRLYISHKGTHEISVINLKKLMDLIKRTKPEQRKNIHLQLGFLWHNNNIIKRIPSGGLGPKGMALSPGNEKLYVANYFSDNIACIDPDSGKVLNTIRLGRPGKMDTVRRGEFLFNDGAHCFQRWLSCTSCHPGVRADGANWDLLNDGMCNPKNVKSLVGAHLTPPSMALGVRSGMEAAVEKGFLFIQFVTPKKEDLEAVRAYLRSVAFIPSPWHRGRNNKSDDLAQLGKKVFNKAGCAECHPPPLYTDLKSYDVGIKPERSVPDNKEFDTPTLLELYRTAPYLHNGAAKNLEEVLTVYNRSDKHGQTSGLTKKEIRALVAFLRSL
jgi:YVTN family beta-propeller protein